MWILHKVQTETESLPAQKNQFIDKNKDEISAKTSILSKLHSNILTPDKIPDFFLPPKLTKCSILVDSQSLDEERNALNSTKASLTRPCTDPALKAKSVFSKLKPIPYSLNCFESGFTESPNTRRKESLFHSAFTSYTLERITMKTSSPYSSSSYTPPPMRR
ncbi:hypothetical protein DNTS_003803 [Danionella cerebrum]|uniref:Uncharacterized protein n=1 Tax=Danionella cerebrum TaxID=2873325 RepID=A0A553N455_9TELE|nr:hypothetical protein DNTS_003803 [Danionella translucida]